MEKRVLVVDDDPPTRRMIATILARAAFAVDVCADDTDADKCLASGEYGAVVLGLVNDNPAIHINILTKVRGLPKPPCVVVLSAGTQLALDAMTSELIRARLRKPFQIDDLVGAVRSCFEDVGPATDPV